MRAECHFLFKGHHAADIQLAFHCFLIIRPKERQPDVYVIRLFRTEVWPVLPHYHCALVRSTVALIPFAYRRPNLIDRAAIMFIIPERTDHIDGTFPQRSLEPMTAGFDVMQLDVLFYQADFLIGRRDEIGTAAATVTAFPVNAVIHV